MTGLVLTAGGARGAYQAGVLRRIGEIPAIRDGPSPFPIVTGASAGAINGAMIAAGSGDFSEATRALAALWSGLTVQRVFRTDALVLVRGGLAFLRDLALGGLLGRTVTQALLDATPLYDYLARVLPLEGIADAIARGDLWAVAVTATSYHSGRSFTFVQGRPGHATWRKSRRVVLPVRLTVDHVCASAAIPLVFAPVRIRSAAGEFYFGDGGLRLVTPFSPAIRLGATHVPAVGIRSQSAAEALSREEIHAAEEAGAAAILCPPLAQVCGVFLNAIFLDHLDADLDHLRRMNELIRAYGGARVPDVSEPMRLVTPLVVTPSQDLAMVAQRFAHRMPRVVRHLMEGLGTPDAQSADLMSYLLFDSVYTRTLLDIGYWDANARIDEIEAFLVDSRAAVRWDEARVATETARPTPVSVGGGRRTAYNPPPMAETIADVLIVGAGASGAALAWSLADTRMNVVCLEQGEWMNPAELPGTSTDWEVRQVGDFNFSPNVRGRREDYPVNDAESPIAVSMFNAVGGSTILYAAHFPRFRPSDFRARTDDGVADDWPIDYARLEPYYAVNARMMGVSGLAGDPAYPPKELPLPPVPLGKLGTTLARGFNRLGWHWWPSDSAIATREHEGRAPCINAGTCLVGCPQGAKGSTDVTYWPPAIRRGVTLKTRCRVREITVGDDGMATGVVYYDADGVERRQRAEVVVVACNGIGTPRLLLNSRSKHFPDGLANRSGLVGKNLMFHPYAMVTGVFDEPLEGYKGPTGCCIMSQEFYETDLSRGFVRGYSFEMLRGFGPVYTALWGMQATRVPWGAAHHRAYAELFDRTAGMVVICEDLPDPANTVTLDPELTDADGIPSPKVTYRLSDNSEKMLAHAVARGKEVLEASGARATVAESPLRMAGWHLMGTCRMGTDPRTSVVNPWGRAHDVRNLFIVDGSIFVTAAAVNPTNTIQALALYVADTMKKNLANLFDAE